jgi:hypothetical protein
MNPETRTVGFDGFSIRLVDEGDIGDLYNFCPTDKAAATFASYAASVPSEDVSARFAQIDVELSADRASDGFVVLSCIVDNRGINHRLRLHIGLDEPVAGSFALSPFEVVERGLRSEGGTEIPSSTWPARGAVLAGGIAVLQPGVFEYEVLTDPPELAITLLRSVGTISRPEIATRSWAAGPDIPTPDAQMPGHHVAFLTLQRGLVPDDLPEAWERAHLMIQISRARGGGDLPDTGSLLELEGAELSSVRKVGGHTEVRIWNPSKETRDVRVGNRSIRLGPARIETIRLD